MQIFNFIRKIKRYFFPFYKKKEIKFVIDTLQHGRMDNSEVAMFVGGCVRKYLKGEKIDDIDVATSLTTEQIKEKFKNTNMKIVDTGIDHGTLTIISKNINFEITSLRKDVKTDGRHAEIVFTNDWKIDSERRDFTINAIYLDINGKIFDPQSGVLDLKNNVVKFIGDPQKRIEEDFLRIIRFLRFSLEYNCVLENSIAQVLKLNLDGIKKISKERIFKELIKILRLPQIVHLNKDKNLKIIFSQIFPEMRNIERLERLSQISNKSKLSVEILLAIILVDGKDNHEYFSHKYNISNTLKDNLNLMAENFIKVLSEKDFFQKNIKKNIYYYGKEHLKALNILYFSSTKKINKEKFLTNLNQIEKVEEPKFLFDGKYLKDQGMAEGILIGKTLKLIENEWIKNDFKIKDSRVLEIINSQRN